MVPGVEPAPQQSAPNHLSLNESEPDDVTHKMDEEVVAHSNPDESLLEGGAQHLTSVKSAPLFEPRLLQLLHADSPLFGTFWPLVFRWLDMEDWRGLAPISKFFNSMAKRQEESHIWCY